MTLEKYISEAISHGWHKSPDTDTYTSFPPNRMAKDAIINWLTVNGFKEVAATQDGPGTDVFRNYILRNEKGYQLGPYGNDCMEQYILFYDGEEMFLIFTSSAKDLLQKHRQEPVSYLKRPSLGKCEFKFFKYISLKYIQKYFESK